MNIGVDVTKIGMTKFNQVFGGEICALAVVDYNTVKQCSFKIAVQYDNGFADLLVPFLLPTE